MKTHTPRTARIVYNLRSRLEFVFDDMGDLIEFKINGVDRSENSDAITHALAAVLEAGRNIQADISAAFDQQPIPLFEVSA